MDVVDEDASENMKRTEKAIRKAAKQEVDMICLPEAVDFGWLYKHARRDAFTIPGKYTDLLSGLAKKFNVWISATPAVLTELKRWTLMVGIPEVSE